MKTTPLSHVMSFFFKIRERPDRLCKLHKATQTANGGENEKVTSSSTAEDTKNEPNRMPKLTYHLIKKGLLQGDDVGLGRNKCWLQRVKNGYQGVFLKILITRWRNTLNGFWILSYMSSNKTFLDHLISNFDFFWWTFDGRNDFIPPPPPPLFWVPVCFPPLFFFLFFLATI